MKKTLITVLSCALAGLVLAGCSNAPAAKHVAQIVDYRIKDAAGNIVARAASSEPEVKYEFSYKLLKDLPNFNGDAKMSYVHYKVDGETVTETSGENFDMLKNAITFEDCEEGIKFKFTKPADFDNVNYINFQYVDSNGQRSTSVGLTDEFYKGKDDIEMIFPLVVAGKKANFWIMLDNGNESQPAAFFFYEIMPAHGDSFIQPLQKDYEETDYISIEEGHILKLHKVIPPKTIKPLWHFIGLMEQNGAGPAWVGGPVNKLYGIFEEASEIEVSAANAEEPTVADYVLDLKDIMTEQWKDNDTLGYPYIFVEFLYQFAMEDFPEYTFATPSIKCVPVPNTIFE